MRDKERIDPMLEKLGEVWKANPDWRLGQLVSNVANSPLAVPENDHYPIYFPSRVDVFYIDDDSMTKFMNEMIEAEVQAPPIPDEEFGVYDIGAPPSTDSNVDAFPSLAEALKAIDERARPMVRPVIDMLVKRIEKAFEDHFRE